MINVVVAYARGTRTIGRNGAIPWVLPPDLRRFRALTMRCPLVMGRKTFDDIMRVHQGRPLPGRAHHVVTTRPPTVSPHANVYFHRSLQLALSAASNAAALANKDVWVIGGASVYAQALPVADAVYATEIDVCVPDGDTAFPTLPAQEWQAVRDASGRQDYFGTTYEYVTYVRTNSSAGDAPHL